MSQSNKRGGGSSGSRNSGSTRGPSTPNRSGGSRPAPVKTTVVRPSGGRRSTSQAEQQGMRGQINRNLPPFSTRRYIAIWLIGLIPLVILLLVLTQTAGNKQTAAQPTATIAAAGQSQQQLPTQVPAATSAPDNAASGSASGGSPKYLIIETTKGRIVAKLHTEADAAVSKTIANFEKKANTGYFNGLAFHRVEDWVIQGGDPAGNGTGGGTMPSEYNKLPFKAGALGVARGGDAAINNDSQFFFVKKDSDFLNGQYTNWGQAVEGLDVINTIAIGDKMTKVSVESSYSPSSSAPAATATLPDAAIAASGAPGKTKYMTIETAKGKIVAKLYTDPSAGVSKTIANFEKKANAGDFNGRTFHRVEDWVIQGGDPTGNGTGGGTMPSEYNKLPFKAGALGVARGGDAAINNDSQFFIVKSDAAWLNGQYTNWGQVTEGMEVVQQIAIGDKMTKVTVEEK